MLELNGDFAGTERFEIRRRLGAGGMGIVYAAYDRERERVVALKTLTHAEASDIYRFKREFRALADVSHPNLVSLYELMSDGVHWFFTMELVDGVDFFSYVRESKTGAGEQSSDTPTLLVSQTNLEPELYTGADAPTLHPEAQTIRPTDENVQAETLRPESPTLRSDAIDGAMLVAPRATEATSLNLKRLRPALQQLAAGVAALHETKNLHCDIKPSNVLVTPECRVVLLDFGLVTETSAGGHHLSLPMAGTPTYMSPEQVAQRRVSEASDWYSVGVMLYEALTGRPPFVGTFLEVLKGKQTTEPPAPSELVPGVPEDLDELCRDLLRRDPRQRPTGREVLRRLAVTTRTGERQTLTTAPYTPARHSPFIGRQRHLKSLEAAFFATRQGKTVTVYIHGSSGMGKSSLVSHYLESLQYRGENVLVLEGRCYERESVPYKALDGVVDSLSRHLMSLPDEQAEELLPKDVRALARLFPVMLQVKAVSRSAEREQETPDLLTLRRRAFAALRELLTRLARRQPMIIYIDDLQWADADGTALLGELLRPPDSPPLLLIASFRSEEIEAKPFLRSLLERAADGEASLALSVAPLSDEEARGLTRSLLPEKSIAEEHVESIVREAAGSPFFVEQLARYALADASAATTGITLSEMLDARLKYLPEGARELVETLAVAGRPVNAEVAYKAAGLSGDEQPLVAALRAAHFLRGGGSNKGIELYHDRMRETMSALLTPDLVRGIHRRLARTLEEKGFDDPESLFEHHLGAGERARAAGYAAEAARKAAVALAFDHAARLYRRALELSLAPDAELVELKAGLGEALANAGRLAEAAQCYLEAARDASPRAALEFRRRAAEHLLMGGHIDEGLEVTRDVLTAVGLKLAPGPKRALLSLLLRRAQLRLRGLKYVERDSSEIPEDDLLRIDICWSVAAGLAVVDNIRGADFQTRHLLLALQSGEPYRIARALAVERGFSATSGGAARERSEKFGEAARSLAEKVENPHAVGMALMNDGIAAYLVGEWKKGSEMCERAAEILRDRCTGVTWELTILNRFMLTTLMYMGEMAEVMRRLPLLISTYKEQGNLYGATDLRTRLNLAWLASDEPDRGRAEIIEAMHEWPHKGFHLQHYGFMHSHAQIMLYTGDSLFAWKYLEEQWPALRSSMLMRIQLLRIEAAHLQARCALAVARAETGAERSRFLRAAERIARRIEREEMRWTEPVVALLRAGIAETRGDSASAHRLLSSAAEGFQTFDMHLYAAVSRRRLGQMLGGDEGRTLFESAGEWMRRQEIKNPQLLTRTLAPGFNEN
ncbi:MAG TPA: protein kinase [Pyrinomonadaceae bacterium]|jgi:serine/threonine protein kinase/tetratricopeptide (TPR) repeat protein